MKQILTLILSLFILFPLSGQDHDWEYGLLLGGSNIGGDLIDPNLSTFKETNFAVGFMAKKVFSSRLGLRLGYYHGSLTGQDSNYERLSQRGFSFSSPVHEFSGQVEWEMLGHKRYRGENFHKTVSPYLLGGMGLSYFSPKTNFNTTSASMAELIALDQAVNASTLRLVLPIGAGIRMDINEQWALGLEYGFRITFSDYLDGVSMSGNPDKNDWYGIGGLNLTYRIGKKDTDQDGVADADDQCPEEFGILSLQGCPDGDMDGIADQLDNCPALAGISLYGGCPDRDGDGIIDPHDSCPDITGLRERSGCPIFDEDKDSIEDKDDACPTVAGPADNDGCPYPDTDEDGIFDKDDLCPDVAGLISMNGCPDSDGDGLADHLDGCPTAVGLSDNDGCPKISAKEVETLVFATKSVQFQSASFQLKTSSYDVLDEIATILHKYPQYDLSIDGYTDSKGDSIDNRKLSENRAFSCMQFFSARGISARRLTYKGFGESNPIATNQTSKGRSLNRRVVFNLVQDDKIISAGQ